MEWTDSLKPVQGSGITVSDGVGGRVVASSFAQNLYPTTTSYLHNYSVVDGSNNTGAYLIVTPGNHYDTTGANTWIPTIGGVAITNANVPKLAVDVSATNVYFRINVINITGSNNGTPGAYVVAPEILAGGVLPSSTNTNFYQLCSGIRVINSAPNCSVTSIGGGVSGSQVSQTCSTFILFGLQ